MKIACITFTYPDDGIKAIIGRQLIPKEWDHYWIVEKRHEYMPIPEGVKKITTHCNRGTHLNDGEFCKEYFEILKQLKHMGYDIIVKVDSDTALYKPECFVWPIEHCGVDYTYIKQCIIKPEGIDQLCNGICYGLNSRIVDCFDYEKKFLDEVITLYKGAEDFVMTRFLSDIKFPVVCNIDRLLIDWCSKRRTDDKVIAGHYGYNGNTNMINCVNEILLAQGREQIKLEDINNYISELLG